MSSSGEQRGRLALDPELASVDLLAPLIDAAPSGILLVRPDGRIALANAAMTGLFGWAPDDLLGRRVEDLIPPELGSLHVSHRADFMDAPVARPMGHNRLLRGRRADDSSFIVEVALSPIAFQGQTCVVAIVRDITNRIDAEELARRQEASEAVVGDRMRIARDLHDSVIQELFAAGLSLAAIEASVGTPFDETITEVIERLDGSMRRLREAVFGLHGRRGARDIPLLVKEAGRILGFEPALTVVGDEVDVPDALWGDIDKVIRECLTNVARHSGATETAVSVSLTPEEVAVEVTDNGRGLEGRNEFGTGFRSLEERAATRGGVLEVRQSPAGGATIAWRVPVDVSVGR